MFPEQPHKFSHAAFLIGSEMVVDMPAEVIAPELPVVFGSVLNQVIECIETKILSFAQDASELFRFFISLDCGIDGGDKGQLFFVIYASCQY